MGQVFTFASPFITVSAGNTVLIEYRTPSNKSAMVHFTSASQSSNDSVSDSVPAEIRRGTPAAAGTNVTGRAVNTQGASPAGSASYGGFIATSPETLWRQGFNVLAGVQRLPTPEIRFELKGGETIELVLTAAPASGTDFSATLEVEEIG